MKASSPHRSSQSWPSTALCLYDIDAPYVLFHGGLGDSNPERRKEFENVLTKIAKQIQNTLKRSPTMKATDLATLGVHCLEDHPLFNAGLGSKLQKDGIARLSGSLMDGKSQRFASVANIQRVKNPSDMVKLLMKERDRNLAALEANQWAFSHGIRLTSPITERRRAEWERKLKGKTGTVGCVALDALLRTAACTSTGGKGFEVPGRVSDSCTPAGNFANRSGAISCTGIGEDILEVSAASAIATRLEDGQNLANAVTRTIYPHVKSRGFGLIALSARREACVHATGGTLAFALVTRNRIKVGTTPEDWKQIVRA